jgi:hypothetical protein
VDSNNLAGKRRVAVVVAILLAGAAISAAILISTRTVITPASFGYIQTDRWTGHTVACSVETPSKYLDRLAENSVERKPNPDYEGDSKAAIDHWWKETLAGNSAQIPSEYLYTRVDPAIAREKTGEPQVCVELD